MQSYLNLIFESCFQWHQLQASLIKYTFISIIIISVQGMGEARVIQVYIFQICFLPKKKTLEGLYWELRWKFSVCKWCPAGWILPSFACFLDAVHTQSLAHASVRPSPARNAVWPRRNGRNESSFHARFSNVLPRSSTCHWKKCLTVTNHSDSWGTSRKICYWRRRCIIHCHASTHPFILQYCVSVASK